MLSLQRIDIRSKSIHSGYVKSKMSVLSIIPRYYRRYYRKVIGNTAVMPVIPRGNTAVIPVLPVLKKTGNTGGIKKYR